MALAPYNVPDPGQVVMCDFGPDPSNIAGPGVMVGPLAVKPEIWKVRHAVVIKASYGIATVVPISTNAPTRPGAVHHRIPAGKYAFLSADDDSWVKAELIETASNSRLDRPFLVGKRSLVHLDAADLRAVRGTVLNALGLGFLTGHL